MLCLIADDHPAFCDAIYRMLEKAFSEVSTVTANSLESLHEIAESKVDPQLIILDLSMPGVYGFSSLIFLRNRFADTPIIIMSAREESKVINEAINYGANGYIPKSMPLEVMIEAIRAVNDGNTWVPPNVDINSDIDEEYKEVAEKLSNLSTRQFHVFKLLTEGYSNQQIADTLFISMSTTKSHVSSIMKTLNVKTRSHVAVLARRLQLADDEIS